MKETKEVVALKLTMEDGSIIYKKPDILLSENLTVDDYHKSPLSNKPIYNNLNIQQGFPNNFTKIKKPITQYRGKDVVKIETIDKDLILNMDWVYRIWKQHLIKDNVKVENLASLYNLPVHERENIINRLKQLQKEYLAMKQEYDNQIAQLGNKVFNENN